MKPVSFALLLSLCIQCVRCQQDAVIIYQITEEQPPKTFVGNVAVDAKLLQVFGRAVLAQVQFGLLPQRDTTGVTGLFQIDADSGVLSTAEKIDRDRLCAGRDTCQVNVDVAIVKPKSHFRVMAVRVDVIDINDNGPEFTQSRAVVKFSESTVIGQSASLPIALDADSPTLGVQRYEMENDGTDDGVFELRVQRKLDGRISRVELVLRAQLDRERRNSYELTVIASDGGSPARVGRLAVNVSVQDANDHRPQFSSAAYSVEVPEDVASDSSIFKVRAHDADSGANAELRYDFTEQTSSMYGHLFGIKPLSGDVYVRASLDYETVHSYSLDVVATDSGVDSLSTHSTLNIIVLDVNDNPPRITINTLSTRAEISEAAAPGTFVAHVSAYDADTGQNGRTTCSLANHVPFRLQRLPNDQYKIVTAERLDREVRDTYELRVSCSDLGDKPLLSLSNLTVSVMDENDNVPRFERQTHTLKVVENKAVGDVLLRLNATDDDIGRNAQITYALASPSLKKLVLVSPDTGDVTLVKPLNYEETRQLRFAVTAADDGHPRAWTATATIIITVEDVNDEAPRFVNTIYEFHVEENAPGGTSVGVVRAVDADSAPFNAFTFDIASEDSVPFRINSTSGEIVTTQSLDREQHSSYYIKVSATDSHAPQMNSIASVTVRVKDVNDNSPVIIYPALANGTVTISNMVPAGYAVFRVQATDMDSADNANLTYSLLHDGQSSAKETAFNIDNATGVISTRVSLGHVAYRKYALRVRVSDAGVPPRRNFTSVVLVVDAAVPYIAPRTKQAGLVGRRNLLIIVVVSSVSGFVIVVLLVAIALLRRFERKDRCAAYCSSSAFMEGDIGDADDKRKGVLYTAYVKAKQLSNSNDEHHKHPADLSTKNPHAPKGSPTSLYDTAQRASEMDRQLELHLLDLLEQERHRDADTSSSGEVSITDSGRGPSEEGDSGTKNKKQSVQPHCLSGSADSRLGSSSTADAKTSRPIANPTHLGVSCPPPAYDKSRHRTRSTSASGHVPKPVAPPQVPQRQAPRQMSGHYKHRQADLRDIAEVNEEEATNSGAEQSAHAQKTSSKQHRFSGIVV